MSCDYQLNLFPKLLTHQKLSSLAGEKFLRAASKMVLKLLWDKWDDEFLPDSIFNQDFFTFLSKNQYSIPSFFKTLLIERAPYFLRAARLEVQTALDRLSNTLINKPPQTENQKLKVELAIYNILSIYVMFSPSPFETLTIPRFIDDAWQGIEFTIEAIELTPTKGWWVNFFPDISRLFSYGFRAKDQENVASILTHCGTGWTTAQGSLIQVIADLWPNKTPGEIFFEWQNQTIDKFIDSNENKVIVNGHSLGGSLSYLTAMARPDRVKKAICLVPPGMAYDYEANHPLFGAYEATLQEERPIVIIQKQTYDPISKCGVFKNDFLLAKVHIKNESKTSNKALRLLTSHARNFSACDDAEISLTNMIDENKSIYRSANNYYLYNKARPIIFYGLLIPYFFIIKPIKTILEKHAFVMALTLFLTLTCLLIPSIAAMLSSVLLLKNTFVSSVVASYFISYSSSILINTFYDLCFNQLLNCKNYFKNLNRKKTLTAIGIFIFDLLNLVSFNLLKISIAIINKFYYDLPNFFNTKQQPVAEIHTEQYHTQTDDLNNYSGPSLKDKLQVLSLIILFYSIVFPIKLICYDLPKFIYNCFSRSKNSQQKSSMHKNNLGASPITDDTENDFTTNNIKTQTACQKQSQPANKSKDKFFDCHKISVANKDIKTNAPIVANIK